MSNYQTLIIDEYTDVAARLGVLIATQINQLIDIRISKLLFSMTEKHYALGITKDKQFVKVELAIKVEVHDDGSISASATSPSGHWSGELPIIFDGEMYHLYQEMTIGARLYATYANLNNSQPPSMNTTTAQDSLSQ